MDVGNVEIEVPLSWGVNFLYISQYCSVILQQETLKAVHQFDTKQSRSSVEQLSHYFFEAKLWHYYYTCRKYQMALSKSNRQKRQLIGTCRNTSIDELCIDKCRRSGARHSNFWSFRAGANKDLILVPTTVRVSDYFAPVYSMKICTREKTSSQN